RCTKSESRSMEVEVVRFMFNDLSQYMERTFRQVAHDRGLEFDVRVDPKLAQGIYTDQRRLQQVLKNLLSNAFKFTEKGRVSINISPAKSGWSSDNQVLDNAESVVAFSVADTGIGISPEKHRIIFEAFQQADGTITRKYGGTGLGLSISREIATLLGGEIRLHSMAGEGSRFTLYVPATYTPDMMSKRRRMHASAQVTDETATQAREPQLEVSLIMENAVD